MNIPMKYEDVVARLDAALGREAALREELANKCEIIKEFHASEILIRESLGRARHRRDEVIDERDALQQRLTVAEQRESSIRLRESLLKEKLSDCEGSLLKAEGRASILNRLLSDASEYTRHPGYDWDIGFSIEVEAALKPAAEGDGS